MGIHKKIVIKTEDGKMEGIAPVIISASRVTDIPAFHAGWFIDRLKEGYVKWTNPYNKRAQYVSFEKARLVVFWTKNAEPVINRLPEIDKRNISYYFNYTLNDYETERIEPGLPALAGRIETFKKLSQKIGKEKVIWRFDPLILSSGLSVPVLLEKIRNIGSELHQYTNKLVISFVDIDNYTRVKRNLRLNKFNDFREFDIDEISGFAQELQKLNRKWGLEISTCCEKPDLSEFGITHNRCVDDWLIETSFPKDKGQRKNCGCVVSKDIGERNTCKYNCAYCYAK